MAFEDVVHSQVDKALPNGAGEVQLSDRERHRAIWDDEAENELRRRIAAGEFVREIARAMGRSQEAIRTRANLLHIPVRFAARRIMPPQDGDAVDSAGDEPTT